MNPEVKKPDDEYADWKAPETSGSKEDELQEVMETEFKENDLITSDTYIGRITELLKANNIRFEVHQVSKALPYRNEQGQELYTIPGEFAIAIFDAEEATKPATSEYTKEIFELVKSQDWPIRYGKRTKIN